MGIPRRGKLRMSFVPTLERVSPRLLRKALMTEPRKHAAWKFDVSLETIRVWLRDGVPVGRRQQLADYIDSQVNGMERELAQLKMESKRLRGD